MSSQSSTFRLVDAVVKDIAFRVGSLGVRFPGQSNWTLSLVNAATFPCCIGVSHGDAPATRHTPRHNTASIMKICFFMYHLDGLSMEDLEDLH